MVLFRGGKSDKLTTEIRFAPKILILFKQSNGTAYTLRSLDVVPGDHNDSNSRLVTRPNGVPYFRSGRVLHGHNADKHQLLFNLYVILRILYIGHIAIHLLVGNAQTPQSLRRILHLHGINLAAIRIRKFLLTLTLS